MAAKKILIVPLDWGLGHATRCQPLIQYFLDKGLEVFIGGNERTNSLLRQEFGECTFLDFRGYEMTYSQKGKDFIWTMIKQMPKILRRIREEKKQLHTYMNTFGFDIVFSDNRFGLRHDQATCWIMTHQLNVLLPGPSFLHRVVNAINRSYLNKFDKIFIPDDAKQSMSGTLSDIDMISDKTKLVHIGNLSRLKKSSSVKKSDRILVVLSGPEPQRTLLEEKIVEQGLELPYSFLVVQAKPTENTQKVFQNIQFISHLNAQELALQMQAASIIISRTGYSTVMDLFQLGLTAILIPTPGQTEQEYLGEYYSEKAWFQIESQENFDLKKSIKKYLNTETKREIQTAGKELYKKELDTLLAL